MSQAYSAGSEWRKSARCEAHNCVEVSRRSGEVAIRNNTLPDVQIAFAEPVWGNFIAGLRAGDFDLR